MASCVAGSGPGPKKQPPIVVILCMYVQINEIGTT